MKLAIWVINHIKKSARRHLDAKVKWPIRIEPA